MASFLSFSFAILFSLLLLSGITPAVGQQINCCDYTVPQFHNLFTNQYWFVLSPANTFIECTTPDRTLYFNNFASQDIFGFAWEMNGCQISSSDCPAGQIESFFLPSTNCFIADEFIPAAWCNEDDFGDSYCYDYPGLTEDDDGGGDNTFLTNFQDTLQQLPCGGSSGAINFGRTWASFTICNGPLNPGILYVNQNIQIRDTTPPTLGIPNDQTVECGVEPTDPSYYPNAIGNDRCNPTVGAIIQNQKQSFTTICGNAQSVATTWTFSDGCNTASGTRIVNSVDTLPPYAQGYFDETFPCTTNFHVATQQNVKGYDLCTSNPTVSAPSAVTIVSPQCAQNFEYVQTWTITDACNNAATVSSTITVYDNIPPVITNPSSDSEQYLICYELLPPALAISASDSCSPTVTNVIDTSIEIVQYEFESQLSVFFPNIRPPGSPVVDNAYKRTIVRNYTSTDPCGNEAYYVQKFYVEQISDVEITLANPSGTISTNPASNTLTISFSVLITSCTVYNLRIIFDAYPLEVISVNGSPVSYEYGYFYYDFGTSTLPGTYSLSVVVAAPYLLSENSVYVTFIPVAQSRIITSNSVAYQVFVN